MSTPPPTPRTALFCAHADANGVAADCTCNGPLTRKNKLNYLEGGKSCAWRLMARPAHEKN